MTGRVGKLMEEKKVRGRETKKEEKEKRERERINGKGDWIYQDT